MKNLTYADIQPYIERGLIAMQTHPEAEWLKIFNYTQECQFSRAWDEVTLQCRGLIMNIRTDTIVARPFPKFFNYEEHVQKGGQIPMEEPQVYEKMDGSLGILYWLHGSPRIATRGSFTSEQAMWGTQWLLDNIFWNELNRDWTYLFEIIYPANRIVVNYDFSGLVFLGTLDMAGKDTQNPYPPLLIDQNWMRRASRMPYFNVEGLQNSERSNFEGYVLFYPKEGLRLKIKLAEYVRLHKLVTGLSKLAIWEHLSEGKAISEMIKDVPDEFFQWVTSTSNQLNAAFDLIRDGAEKQYNGIIEYLSLEGMDRKLTVEERKAFAECAQQAIHPSLMFALLDSKPLNPMVWRMVRPKGAQPFKNDIDA